jgi:hypothetical protein
MKIALKYLTGVSIWLIAYIIIRNVHSSYFADYFSLSNFTAESTQEYFKLICEITASVFAILLAVITFGFELLGNNSRRRKRFNFLTQWWVSFTISIPVVIILFSLHSAFSIQNLKQTNDLTTAYFIGIMFVVFVLSLFPFTVFLIRQTDTVDEVKNSIRQFTGSGDFDSVITDELIYYIQDFDRDAYNSHLLPTLNQQCLALIGDARDRKKTNEIFQSLTKVWITGNVDAARVNEEQYFVSIWLAVKGIYFHAAENKSFLLHYQEIEDFIRTQIEYLTVKNSVEGLSSAAEIFSEIYLHQLQFNCPKQETIRDLYWANEDRDAPNPHPDADLQWNHINEILWQLHQLQKNAVELKSKHLFETVKGKLGSILFNLRYNHDLKLGNYQERFIVFQIFSFQTWYAQLALESGMFKYAYEAFHFSSFEISDYVKEQKIFAGDIIKQIEDYLLYCQKNNYMDDSISVRDLGGLGRLITMNYTANPIAQTELLSVIEILSKLKIEIQKQANYLEDKNYSEIKKELESFKVQLEKVKDNSSAANTISRIDEIVNTY